MEKWHYEAKTVKGKIKERFETIHNIDANVEFGSEDFNMATETSFRAEMAKEDLGNALQEAKDMITYYESVAMRLEALLLLKVVKN